MAASGSSLLPPLPTPLERALEGATARVGDVPVPITELWDPDTCPLELLPWLAWALAVDIWDATWSEETKRERVRTAVDRHRRKGTRGAVREVLDSHDPDIALVEWWERPEPGEPYTFDLEIDLTEHGGARATAAFLERVLSEVETVKPVRAHVVFTQQLRAQGDVGVLGHARAATFVRLRCAADTTSEPVWATLVLTEDGEPFEAEDGQFIQREEIA